MSSISTPLPSRQRYESGILRWLSTTDHKDIGILYTTTAMIFFLIGGIEALLIRIQLGAPDQTFLTPTVYNEIFTMHGTTMIFLFAMPIIVGLGNYMVPLMIGARDMAFPRLNALSYWLFLTGGILLYSSFLLGGAPAGGWFAYTPLTTLQYSPGHGMDYWILGIIITGFGSTAGAINFVVTILNMRAPGMSFFRMPLFVWQILVTVFLMLFALPALTVDAILLYLERSFGANFFSVTAGGDPLLWQHLFWFFGHPEVYILILPAFGIISEIVPVFSRKPIFGYGAIAFSGIAIGFLGFTVWAHHMFAVGMSPLADSIFALDSMIIAVPTSIKIFNWTATMWGGKIDFKTPMLFAVGMIAMFIIGGLSGVAVAVIPFDLQVTDTYFVVAHFHYVLFGGTVMAFFGGLYYWLPKITGRLLDDRLGKWNFWTMLIGFNITFFPMHILGLLGMPRRIWTYGTDTGWGSYNLLETVGGFIIAFSVLLFVINFFVSVRKGQIAGNDPWDGQTLEWLTSSPPPKYNFAVIPHIHGRRPAWDLKHPELLDQDELDREAPPEFPKARPGAHVHVPMHSLKPIVVGVGVTIFGYGMIYHNILIAVGIATFLFGIISWVNEYVPPEVVPSVQH
jgi:cytochrome c oxidase subunit 1